jgi:Protein of unknown function (DUF433)
MLTTASPEPEEVVSVGQCLYDPAKLSVGEPNVTGTYFSKGHRRTTPHVSTGAHHDGPGGLPRPAGGPRAPLPGANAPGTAGLGHDVEEVLADYPDLERDDLLAALEFGALTAGGQRIDPPGAA